MAISATEEPRRPTPLGPLPERLGRYEVIERLAVGGMAEVFVCYERGLGGLERLAVVKRILPQLAAQEDFIGMFLAEARYVARLNHPNVVQVFELAQDDDGTPFLVMEYISGNSIRELIVATLEHGTKVPVGAAVGMTLQACSGAHAAHELADASGRSIGLVHRDISPHNLMVTGEGHVKLLDFGIAKATEVLSDEQTRTGGLKGKIHYMSPEQCKQEPLDRRSDVFALAIVLWETLAAERLFKRKSELEAMQAIIRGEIRELSELRPDVPEAVRRTLLKALAPDREQRYSSADELRKALLEACAAHRIPCSPDAVAAFVRPLLGERQRVRHADLLARGRDPGLAPAPGSTTTPEATASSLEPVAATRVLLPPLPPARRSLRAWYVIGGLALAGLVLGVAFAATDRVLAPKGPPLAVGFAPTADAALILEDVEPLRKWLEQSLGRPTRMSIAPSYEGLQAQLLAGELELAALPPYLYLETVEKDPSVQIVASKMVQGSSGNDGIIYVSEHSQIHSVAELKGKRLCFPDKKSTTGYLFPRLALRRAGLDPDRDVTGHLSGNHLQALRDLVAGECDAAATYSGNFLAADRAGIPVAQIKQLATTERSPHEAMVVPAKVAEADRLRIQAALLSFLPRDGGNSGRVERISGFKLPDSKEYDAVKEALSGEHLGAP